MNAADRDVQLVWMLDEIEAHEKHARARKDEAAARGDGEGFKRWADILSQIRREQERIENELLADIEAALEEET